MSKFATIEEIQHAHNVLLKDKPFFEQDKVEIIECDETKDIKACPGSGKTTTLLAKLIILANRMPLENNQGICVLTHTNVAIDEIKSKLGNKADILFKYPNHFGTIQSFVDKFLAIPHFIQHFSKRPQRISDDVYQKCLERSYRNKIIHLRNTNEPLKKRISYYFLSNEGLLMNLHLTIVNNEFEVINTQSNSILDIKKPKSTSKNDWTHDEKKEIKNTVIDIIKNVYGYYSVLGFHDAYTFSKSAYLTYPKIKQTISSRFKYVFVDEMQDTDEKQLELITNVFDSSKTIIQQFGDHHQSIYNKVSDTEIWSPNSPLEIKGSKRFGENIAKILRTVCIENNSSLKANENIQSLQPIMIVFDDPKDVLPKYTELLLSRHVDGKSIWELAKTIRSRDPQNRQNIKAIGWVGKVENEFNIKSYFTDFNSQLKKDKVNYDSLKSFLCKQEKNTLKIYSDKIIEALLHLLSIANLRIDNRTYTKTSLEVDFARRSPEKYILFREQTAIWTKEIHSSESYNNETIIQIKNYLKSEFCPLFGIDPSNTYVVNFIDNETSTVATQAELENQNIFKKDDVEVEVATIHSVKGETHIATLYMETSYYGEHEGARIIDQIIGKTYTPPKRVKDTHRKESLKMAYVGMSRPIYLLCFAIHADRFNAKESELRKCGLWEIVYTKEDKNQV